jgi:hypothetical protein
MMVLESIVVIRSSTSKMETRISRSRRDEEDAVIDNSTGSSTDTTRWGRNHRLIQ